MVSSLIVDTIRDPTSSIQSLFESDWLDNFPAKVSTHFAATFASEDAFNEIPSLDINNPPEAHCDRSLVRFRAMVQDLSLAPVMYLAKDTDGNCGGWGIETASADHSIPNYEELRECSLLWAVNIPGESSWCAQALNGSQEKSGKMHSAQREYKWPILGSPHIGVQVKIYQNSAAEQLRSTDILTFVGILTSEPYYTDESETPLTVPTLHVVFTKSIPPTVVTRKYPSLLKETEMTFNPLSQVVMPGSETLREELITWIAKEALLGDKIAAEWVLLTVISRVVSRNPPVLPPSLTLSRFPPSLKSNPRAGDAPRPALSHILEAILPLTLFLPLSLPFLNEKPAHPSSIQEDLHSGYLQLPAGSSVVLSEGGLEEGKVEQRGLKNLHAIQDVMSTQTLIYAYPFSQYTFPTDINFIVLCEGRRSAFFQTSVCVPLCAEVELDDGAKVSDLYKSASQMKRISPEKITAFRELVGGSIAGGLSKVVGISKATSEYIQESFVRERKENSLITVDDLMLRMTVAKLLALSLNASEVTTEIWERAKALDESRRARTP